jgi:hypothetical protein
MPRAPTCGIVVAYSAGARCQPVTGPVAIAFGGPASEGVEADLQRVQLALPMAWAAVAWRYREGLAERTRNGQVVGVMADT